MPENIPLSDKPIAVAPTVQQFRRLITGLDDDGHSTVVSDETCAPRADHRGHPDIRDDRLLAPREGARRQCRAFDDGLSGPVEISPPPVRIGVPHRRVPSG